MNKMEQMEKRIAELEAKLNNVTTSTGTKPWNKVREHMLEEIDKLELGERGERYKLHTGITAIIRYALDLETVRDTPTDKTQQAMDIADQVIGMVKEHREQLINDKERG